MIFQNKNTFLNFSFHHNWFYIKTDKKKKLERDRIIGLMDYLWSMWFEKKMKDREEKKSYQMNGEDYSNFVDFQKKNRNPSMRMRIIKRFWVRIVFGKKIKQILWDPLNNFKIVLELLRKIQKKYY